MVINLANYQFSLKNTNSFSSITTKKWWGICSTTFLHHLFWRTFGNCNISSNCFGCSCFICWCILTFHTFFSFDNLFGMRDVIWFGVVVGSLKKWIILRNCPANIYLFIVNNRNLRKRCEICSKLTIKNLFKVNNKDIRTTSLTSFWCLYC